MPDFLRIIDFNKPHEAYDKSQQDFLAKFLQVSRSFSKNIFPIKKTNCPVFSRIIEQNCLGTFIYSVEDLFADIFKVTGSAL